MKAGDEMRVVNALLVKDGKILLLFKESRQKWFLPGGKSEFGENVIQTGCREFLEETGLNLKNVKLGAVTTVVINELKEEWLLCTVIATDACGHLIEENREGKLQLHPVSTLDQLPMFEGDRFVVKELLLRDHDSPPIISAQFYTPTYELEKIVVDS